jgi:hypothetical protein
MARHIVDVEKELSATNGTAAATIAEALVRDLLQPGQKCGTSTVPLLFYRSHGVQHEEIENKCVLLASPIIQAATRECGASVETNLIIRKSPLPLATLLRVTHQLAPPPPALRANLGVPSTSQTRAKAENFALLHHSRPWSDAIAVRPSDSFGARAKRFSDQGGEDSGIEDYGDSESECELIKQDNRRRHSRGCALQKLRAWSHPDQDFESSAVENEGVHVVGAAIAMVGISIRNTMTGRCRHVAHVWGISPMDAAELLKNVENHHIAAIEQPDEPSGPSEPQQP